MRGTSAVCSAAGCRNFPSMRASPAPTATGRSEREGYEIMLHQVYDGGNVDTAYSTFATTIEKTTKNNNENSTQSIK